MFISDINLSTTQTIVYYHFRCLLNGDKTNAEVIMGFLDKMEDKKLLIKNLESLLQKSMDEERICVYVNSAQFEKYWETLLEYIGLLPQPNFSNFELLAGMSLYYGARKDRAATEYNFFLALKELNDANQAQLGKAIQGQQVDPINCLAMYRQALLAQKHGTPGYVLIASVCFWIAIYYKLVIKNELTAVCYYQLAVQNLYCAYILKDHCKTAIANAHFSPDKQPTPITNEYDFFSLLANIEDGRVEDMVQHIQRKAGTRLLGKLEIYLARQRAINVADQFVRDKFTYIPAVPVNCDDAGAVVASSTFIS